MKYTDGQEVQVGDKVRLSLDNEGVVVCSMDSGVGTPEYPYSEWAHLNSGVMIWSAKSGLFHYDEPDEDLELLARA